jgi:hypothetical protein
MTITPFTQYKTTFFDAVRRRVVAFAIDSRLFRINARIASLEAA